MNIKLNSSVKIGIISGIIASVFFMYFVDPIITTIGKIVLGVSKYIHSSYLDRLYAEIAVGDPNFAFALYGMLILFFAGILTGTWTSFIYFLFRRTRNIDEKEKEESEKQKGLSARKVLVAATTSLIILVFLLFDLVDSHIRLKTTSSFKQHLTILSPYLNQSEIIKFESDFASMKSKSDYDSIIEKMNTIASKNKVSLPENKLYPF